MGGGPCIRVCGRALEGMQKEAVVARRPGGRSWRFLCDEGPYLEGSDLAPPPLAYFAAGMAAHNAALLMEEAARAGVELGKWSLRQDTFYSMEGSALKGTMMGGAMPAHVGIDSDSAGQERLCELAAAALKRSVAEGLMARAFSGEFSINHNGTPIGNGRVRQVAGAAPDAAPDAEPDADPAFEAAGEPLPAGVSEIIHKLETVEPSTDPTHGRGASLRESQKRILHLHTVVEPKAGGLLQLDVELRRPLGSTFRFHASSLAVEPADAAAPDGLDYLAAGIALCFLTQMGRFAKITRGDLAAYSVVQDLHADADPAGIRALVTHARIESREDPGTVRRYVDMSEQTCFLHASCRSSNPTQIETGTEP